MVEKVIASGSAGLDYRNTEPSPFGGTPEPGCGPAVERTEPLRVPDADHPRTAFDVKEAHRQLLGWTDDELKQVPLTPVGARLEPGMTYVDLRDPARREFTASGEMQVPQDGLYVPRSAVDHRTWNRLLGVRTAEGMGMT